MLTLGNKSDLDNVVPQSDIDRLIDDTDYAHHTCSAKDNINVEELFINIARDLIQYEARL